MRKSMRIKHFVAPALLTLAAMGLGTGCSSAKNALAGATNCGTGDAGASLTAKFDAFKAAVTDLNDVQGTITSKVAIACVNIAKGLDSTTNASLPTYTDGQVVSSTDTKTACDAATAAITKIKANGAVTIAVVASALRLAPLTLALKSTAAPSVMSAQAVRLRLWKRHVLLRI